MEDNSDTENYYDYEYNYYESLTKKNTKLIKRKRKRLKKVYLFNALLIDKNITIIITKINVPKI